MSIKKFKQQAPVFNDLQKPLAVAIAREIFAEQYATESERQAAKHQAMTNREEQRLTLLPEDEINGTVNNLPIPGVRVHNPPRPPGHDPAG